MVITFNMISIKPNGCWATHNENLSLNPIDVSPKFRGNMVNAFNMVSIKPNVWVYSIQLYVIKFVSDFQLIDSVSSGTLVSSTNKT
jgi:hypothetical protein